ncbi:MAG: hypothetical protein JRI36_00145 [Deltaproteobacteria bacterium]|nr:hypothetical protein [Deltaproteobacteria bacterium]
MEELKKYIGRTVELDNVKDSARLKELGFTCRYLPDPPEDFDEFEFVADLGGFKNLGLMVTVESMTVKKIFFGLLSPDDPDVVTGLTEEQVQKVFADDADALAQFFEFITRQHDRFS